MSRFMKRLLADNDIENWNYYVRPSIVCAKNWVYKSVAEWLAHC